MATTVNVRMTHSTISSRAPHWSSRPASLFSAIGCTSMLMPKMASSVSMSTARSTTTVASSVVLDRPSRRASAHGRTNSPSRNGSTLFAMNPIIVALNSESMESGRPAWMK